MPTREIQPQHRPVYDYTASRPQPPTSRFQAASSQSSANPHGDKCVVAFYYKNVLMFRDSIAMLETTPARAVLTAVQDALQTWRTRCSHAPHELKNEGFGTDAERWDEAEVNGKRFPRPTNL
jgi:hypothetical protein